MIMKSSTMAFIASGIVVAMLGLAFASKPLYDKFCKVTGFGGTTRVATAAPSSVLDREIEVRFDANVSDAPLLFRPLKVSYRLPLGAHGLASYEVTNTSLEDISVMAGYNVTPHTAGRYFNKLECFCFEERIIKAGETKTLPVVFFVSPEMAEEKLMDAVTTITLSYTFYQTESFTGTATTAALTPGLALSQ